MKLAMTALEPLHSASSSSLSCARARDRREWTVPTGTPRVAATSAGESLSIPLRAMMLRPRRLRLSGSPMKASFRHRLIERFLESGPDPVLTDLTIAEAARAAGGLPASGVSNVHGMATLWWSERQLKDRFEQAWVCVTLGENG